MKRSGSKGFSLIELSIVILILSMIATAVLTLYGRKDVADKNRETTAKMQKIITALKIYYDEKGYLPCPALSGANPATNINFGNSGPEGDDDCDFAQDEISDLVSGTIPIAVLGLPYQYIFDAWGNRISYVIHKDLTETWDSSTESNILIKGNGSAYINYRKPNTAEMGTSFTDCGGESIGPAADFDDNVLDCPAILLISHGANGLFAYNVSGNGPRISTFGMSTIEKDNTPVDNSLATFDNIFRAGDINQDTKDSSYFDDIVIYKSMNYFRPN